MSALAVLLIIGSAVVGPIEAQRQAFPLNQTNEAECMAIHGTSVGGVRTVDGGGPYPPEYYCREVYKRRGEIESLPELCERAMKEIGAEFSHWGQGGHEYGWRLTDRDLDSHQMTVRCIQVPTGYRK